MKKLLIFLMVAIIAISNASLNHVSASNKTYFNIIQNADFTYDRVYTQSFDLTAIIDEYLWLENATNCAKDIWDINVCLGDEYNGVTIDDLYLHLYWIPDDSTGVFPFRDFFDSSNWLGDMGIGSWEKIAIDFSDSNFVQYLDGPPDQYEWYLSLDISSVRGNMDTAQANKLMDDWITNTKVYIGDDPIYLQGYQDAMNDLSHKVDDAYDLGYSHARAVFGELIQGTWIDAETRYNQGVSDGYGQGLIDADFTGLDWIMTFFGLFSMIFSIELLPNITIGLIIGVPIMFKLFFAVLRIIRGG